MTLLPPGMRVARARKNNGIAVSRVSSIQYDADHGRELDPMITGILPAILAKPGVNCVPAQFALFLNRKEPV